MNDLIIDGFQKSKARKWHIYDELGLNSYCQAESRNKTPAKIATPREIFNLRLRKSTLCQKCFDPFWGYIWSLYVISWKNKSNNKYTEIFKKLEKINNLKTRQYWDFIESHDVDLNQLLTDHLEALEIYEEIRYMIALEAALTDEAADKRLLD